MITLDDPRHPSRIDHWGNDEGDAVRPGPVLGNIEITELTNASRTLLATTSHLSASPTGQKFAQRTRLATMLLTGSHPAALAHIILAEVIGNQVLREILVQLVHYCCLIQSLYCHPLDRLALSTIMRS